MLTPSRFVTPPLSPLKQDLLVAKSIRHNTNLSMSIIRNFMREMAWHEEEESLGRREQDTPKNLALHERYLHVVYQCYPTDLFFQSGSDDDDLPF